jgi:5-methyltetrahydropteroyltriglutamate--homocysteine methyltransferase
MNERPLRTTVVGSYPFPGWLELASEHLDRFGETDVAGAAGRRRRRRVGDQVAAGLDVVTDGEQTRLDFNLSFYGYLEGIELEAAPPRRFGPPAHDQRGRHRVTGELRAPRGARRRRRLPAASRASRRRGPTLKASVPGRTR